MTDPILTCSRGFATRLPQHTRVDMPAPDSRPRSPGSCKRGLHPGLQASRREVEGCRSATDDPDFSQVRPHGERVITDIQRITVRRRVYCGRDEVPQSCGLGTSILTTSRGS